MPDYAALKTELAKPAYTGMDSTTAAAAINALTVSTFVDVEWSALREIVMSNGDWGALVYTERRASGVFLGGGAFATATQVMAVEFADSCRFGGVLKTSVAAVRTRMSTRLATLAGAAVGAISAASQSEMIALATKATPTAATWGFAGLVSYTDVEIARALP